MTMLGRIKTVALVTLVVLSIVLSYLLWRGNWQNATEVGFSSTGSDVASSTSIYPRLPDAAQPEEIVVTKSGVHHAAVIMPGTPLYDEMVNSLNQLHVYTTHFSEPKKTINKAAEITFLYSVNPAATSHYSWWTTLGTNGSSTVFHLYQETSGGSVYAKVGDGESAETDESSSAFTDQVKLSMDADAWQVWNDNGLIPEYLPANGSTVNRFVYQSNGLSTATIGRLFFVNPEVVTRIQEGTNNIIWTDGSRAVEWMQSDGTMKYEDPSAATSTSGMNAFDASLSFIRTHGGSPEDVIASEELSDTEGLGEDGYILTPYVEGMPLLDDTSLYSVKLLNRRVTEFVRPLWSLGNVESKRVVHLQSMDSLSSELKSLLNVKDPRTLDVQIGYHVSYNEKTQMVVLEPAYYVSRGTDNLLVLDAVTGAVLEGGTGQ